MRPRTKFLIIIGAWTCILLALLMPGGIRPRRGNPQAACINNLRQIDGAKQTWAIEHPESTNRAPTWQDIQPYLGRGKAGRLPKCPQGGTYTLGILSEPPRCS